MRLGTLGPGQHPVDDGAHLSRLHCRPHVLDHRGHDGALLLDGPGPQCRCVHRRALGHQPSEVELALRSPLQTDDDQPTVGRECADVVVEVLRPDDVQQHIDPLTIGEIAGGGDPVLLAVVDRGVRSEGQTGVHLALAAAGDDRPGSEQRGHLDRHRADSGASAVDEEGLPFAQTGDHHQVGPDRAGDLGERSRLHQRDRGRAPASPEPREPRRVGRTHHPSGARRRRPRPASPRLHHRRPRSDPSTPARGRAVRRAAAGSDPRRCSRSARLTPAATTSITTSDGPGSGSGTSVS